MTVARVYKRRVVLAFESLFLANLIFLISTLLYQGEHAKYSIITIIFLTLALLKIIIIVIMNLIISIRSCCVAKCKRLSSKDSHNEQGVELTVSARFRDSILEDKVEPLLPREGPN